jgi:dTDP-4-amino-4,6-dideoxygalactose transaminase
MARAHGMSRNLIPYQRETIFSAPVPWDINTYYPWECEPIYNPLVDQQFNFHVLSSNYRNTDIAAFCSLLDFKRVDKNRAHRKKIYSVFKQNLDPIRYYLPPNRFPKAEDVAFCLPIIVKGEDKENRIKKVKDFLDKKKIERRGFISGNMLRQTCYKKYGNYKDYENAEYINDFAIYIGLNQSTAPDIVLDLVEDLNKL